MKNWRVIKILSGGLVSLTLALTSCGGGGGGESLNSSGVRSAGGESAVSGRTPALMAINISPANPLGIRSGTQLQFTAMGSYSDNSVKNVTTLVTWTSSDPFVATVSNRPGSMGMATAVSRGYCSISATFEGASVSTIIGVN